MVAIEPVDAAPGLLVPQATHLSLLDMLFIIQVGHSHDPDGGLNCVSSDDCNQTTMNTELSHQYLINE